MHEASGTVLSAPFLARMAQEIEHLAYFKIETEGASRESWLRAVEGRSAILIAAMPGVTDPRFSLFVELLS